MKVPVRWLNDFIATGLSTERVAELLTLSGSSVERVSGSGDDAVLELEVTSNRPDCLSLAGVARELSALTGKKARVPSVRSSVVKTPERVSVTIEDKKACPRYTARLIRGVRVAVSPEEVHRRLELAGVRPISNAVDATNYAMLECGQPMHAFDFDKLSGGRIHVRRSRKGEKFTAIDGVIHELDSETIVIADAERAIAIAGVIGGKDTEVTDSTTNVLLESAYFDPIAVRRARRKYKTQTDSSYRFERGVDPSVVGDASARAAALIAEWSGGKDVSGLLEAVKWTAPKPRSIELRAARIERLLGIKVPLARAAAILRNLGFEAKPKTAGTLTVKTNPARRDVAQEADLIEEVLRIEGFDKVPGRLPVTRHPVESPENRDAAAILELKGFLAHRGLNEILTYSLLSSKNLSDSGVDPSSACRIRNPLSLELEYYRPDLLPGMLNAILFNVRRKATSLGFFEIGRCLRSGIEETWLSVAFHGMVDETWNRKSPASFFDAKAALEDALAFLRAGDAAWEAVDDARFSTAAALSLSSRVIGVAGDVSDELLRRWDVPHPVHYAALRLDGVGERATAPVPARVKPVPKFPAARRDVAFLVKKDVPVREIERAMREAAGPTLAEIQLFDQYTGKGVPDDKRSLAFALEYRKPDGTFTDDEITRLQTAVIDGLKTAHGAEMRA